MLTPARAATVRQHARVPSHPLFLVDRARPIPPDFPLGRHQTWRRCDQPKPAQRGDLVCLPSAYTNRAAVLRQIAWDSPRPRAIKATKDGLPVGYRGRVGFKAMIDAARKTAGHHLVVTSAFRPYAVQKAIFEDHVRREMAGGLTRVEARAASALYSAQPGHSEHQLGTTADLTYGMPDGSNSGFGGFMAERMHRSAAMTWVRANAHRFGIVMTYRRDRIEQTQYAWEPWHWRFVGVEAADAMRQCDLSVAEFLEQLHGVRPPPKFVHEDRLIRHAVTVSAHRASVASGSGQAVHLDWTLVHRGSQPLTELAMWAAPATRNREYGPRRGTWRRCITPGQEIRLQRAIVTPEKPGIYRMSWTLRSRPGGWAAELTAEVVVTPGQASAVDVTP